MSRHRHTASRDLPVIHEVQTPTEDDDTGDEQSYAFTLDGVGFDEESGSILHTPPSLMSYGNSSNDAFQKHEADLHRETCRQLGIPFDEGNVSPGRDGGSSSSSSSGNASGSTPSSSDESSTRENPWPWPEASNGNSIDSMFDVPLESDGLSTVEGKRNGSGNSKTNEKGRPKLPKIDMSRVSQVTSSYSSMVREVATSFADRSKTAIANSKRRRISDGTSGPSGKRINFGNLREFIVNWNNEATHMYKLTVAATMVLLVICVVAVVGTMGTSNNSSRPDLAETGPHTTIGDPLIQSKPSLPASVPATAVPDESIPELNETAIDTEFVPYINATNITNITVSVEVPNTTIVTVEPEVLPETATPILAPSIAPTKSPFKISIPFPEGEYMEPCINREGRFHTDKGKKRQCHWLTLHDSEELFSERQDENCGVSGNAPSELGLNCRYTCRAYNGCLKGNGSEDGQIARVQPVPDDAVSSSNEPNEEQLEENGEENSTGNYNGLVLGNVEASTFIDSRGRERPCKWLDIRNLGQQKFRRNANCGLPSAKLSCPSSCVDYIDSDTFNSNVFTTHKNNTEVPHLTRAHAPVPQDMCYDGNGYYLNENNHPRKCEWLVDKNDPFDDSRLIKNCGYSNGHRLTDLGRMCKHTCGTCNA
mmetsp:Transcript_21874/g.45536  ORF Transcript_21874/g.45536 Transcript_21874/m.45536 type:complete len:651 (+) Transcript_21874:218-2170(+)